MTTTYTPFSDLAKGVQPPGKGILSRTLFTDDWLKAVGFGFAQGEELPEHTASMPAVLHFLQGEAKLTTLGEAPARGGNSTDHGEDGCDHARNAGDQYRLHHPAMWPDGSRRLGEAGGMIEPSPFLDRVSEAEQLTQHSSAPERQNGR